MALTDIEIVRLNITDTGTEQLFTDEQLSAWLDQFGGSINRATYRALVTIATSEVLVSKKIRTQDLATDGPAVADSLLKLAGTYKADADTEDATAGFSFEVIPLADPFKPEGAEYRW
jgi:hypothetical protein